MAAEDEQGGTRDVHELAERAVDDVSQLAHAYAGVAKREVVAAGEHAAWPATIAVVGGLMACTGLGLFVASPAIPSTNRRLKRRTRGLAYLYIALGGAAAAFGLLALTGVVSQSLPRTRRGLRDVVETVQEHL